MIGLLQGGYLPRWTTKAWDLPVLLLWQLWGFLEEAGLEQPLHLFSSAPDLWLLLQYTPHQRTWEDWSPLSIRLPLLSSLKGTTLLSAWPAH